MKTYDQEHSSNNISDIIRETLIALTMALIVGFLFSGCATRTETVYIEPKCPELQVYEIPPKIKLHVFNRGDTVCVREWNSTCIPREKFLELLEYTTELRNTAIRYRNQTELFNNFFSQKK